ncbi:hypothetical protein [uncultured Mediterranean phage uvMED]|nr:hypothetical protein [uncultured Mediterranean phage uvMED]
MIKKIILILLIATPAFAVPYSGTYPTIQVRSLWSHCFDGLTRVDRISPSEIHAYTCDCILDKTRVRYPYQKLVDTDNRSELFRLMFMECIGMDPI